MLAVLASYMSIKCISLAQYQIVELLIHINLLRNSHLILFDGHVKFFWVDLLQYPDVEDLILDYDFLGKLHLWFKQYGVLLQIYVDLHK